MYLQCIKILNAEVPAPMAMHSGLPELIHTPYTRPTKKVEQKPKRACANHQHNYMKFLTTRRTQKITSLIREIETIQ